MHSFFGLVKNYAFQLEYHSLINDNIELFSEKVSAQAHRTKITTKDVYRRRKKIQKML